MQWFARPTFTLRRKLIILLSAITCLILLGQTLILLSSEVTDLDAHAAARGTIVVQGIANSCATILDGTEPRRFDSLLDRISRSVDLVELTITDRAGNVLARRSGKNQSVATETRFDVFGAPRANPGIVGLFTNNILYAVSAPIVRGTVVIGFVGMRFRSSEIADKSTRLIGMAMAMALFWLILGSVLGSVYVRRITGPLADLTHAAQAVTAGRLADVAIEPPTTDDEVGVLQGSFAHLVAALRAERAENARLMDSQQQLNARLRQRVDEVTADLRETANYLQSVIRAMEEGVITCDEHGEIVEVNLGAVRHLHGFTRPTPGGNIAELLPDAAPLQRMVDDVLHSGHSQTLELVRVCATAVTGTHAAVDTAALGGQRTLFFRAYPIRGANKQPMGAVLIITDETAARLVEVRMRRHDRLISLGTIAAGLAHELGNYMHAIHGFAALLLRETPPDDPRRSDLTAIRDENQRAIGLLERFLQFARPGHLRFGPESLAGLIKEAAAMCAFRLRKDGIVLDTDLARLPAKVTCDGGLLVQVFINLILNAADAMSGRTERRMHILGEPGESGRILLRFSDVGTGIAPEHLEQIFDPFFTTKIATGTGLGLSIAHKIVEVHGGTLTVQSSVGVGTTFIIDLPIMGPREES
jgi:signal transduction histidine kinase